MNRFFNKNKNISSVDPKSTYILIDSSSWAEPCILSLEQLSKELQVQISNEIFERNVTSNAFISQEIDPSVSPEILPFILRTNIAVDKNYLYVWIPQLERWKRIPLSEWESP